MVADILDSKDELVKAIIEKTGMSESEINAKIREKQEEYGGLLTEAGAAYSIAKEMGVVTDSSQKKKRMQIGELQEGLDAVNVVGIVSHVFPVKEWEKDGRRGKVGKILIRDNTGEIRVVLWNADCDLIESGTLTKGTIVEVQNASVKKSNEMLDLNIGIRGRINVLDSAEDLPEINEDIVTLDKIEEGMNDISVYARVVRVFPEKTFESNGRKGRVASVIISDGTKARLVLWNENAIWANRLRENDIIKVEGAYVRNNNGTLELNLGWRGHLVVNPNDAPVIPEVAGSKRVNIKDLKPGDRYRELRAVVVKVYKPNVFEICPKCGARIERHCDKCNVDAKKSIVVNAELDDGTGVIRASFYRDIAERFLGFSGEKYAEDESLFDETKYEGSEYIFQGQVKHNDAFDRDEFVVRGINDVNVQKEIERLEGE
ncbi:MAG: DUF2240 family protein [Candidatus Diapherotrites archaeon]|nr:DUF2240 family protein [Candidatus Diapherotrites archaeon]